jgi:hypothetical protein
VAAGNQNSCRRLLPAYRAALARSSEHIKIGVNSNLKDRCMSKLQSGKATAVACCGVVRAANESSSSESGLAQTRLMKIRVELSRAREMLRAEKSSLNSARYYSN